MSMVKVFPHRVELNEIDPKTNKPRIKTTYHTKPDGKGDLVKSIIGVGGGEYYLIKRIDGTPVITDEEHAALVQANSKRLNNPDLIKALDRLQRVADRIEMARKKYAKLMGDDAELHTETEYDKIIGRVKGVAENVATSCYKPLTGSGGSKAETPDIF